MDEGKRFLIVLVEGESYAIPFAGLQEITAPRDIRKDPSLSGLFAGQFELRGKLIPVLDIKKLFRV